jgi:hypothetical protein
MASGDPEAIVLFGLRGEGLKLLSNFLDRTADVQTVALASCFVSPGLIRSDRRIERWIQTYRTALDGLKLYSARALFDNAQGRRARIASEQARLSGRNAEANEVEAALRKAAPPQMVVRCQFCSTNISPSGQLSLLDAGERGGVGPIGVRVSYFISVALACALMEDALALLQSTLCPTCSKSLPGCSVCLAKPSIHSFSSDGCAYLALHAIAFFRT